MASIALLGLALCAMALETPGLAASACTIDDDCAMACCPTQHEASPANLTVIRRTSCCPAASQAAAITAAPREVTPPPSAPQPGAPVAAIASLAPRRTIPVTPQTLRPAHRDRRSHPPPAPLFLAHHSFLV